MKSAKTLFFSVLILFPLTFLFACPVRASETTKMTYCSNACELYEALLYHPTTRSSSRMILYGKTFPM